MILFYIDAARLQFGAKFTLGCQSHYKVRHNNLKNHNNREDDHILMFLFTLTMNKEGM